MLWPHVNCLSSNRENKIENQKISNFLNDSVCIACTVRSINIGTLTQFSSFWLYIPPQWIWNKKKNNMRFNCRLSALIWGYLHPNQVNGVGITTVSICASHFFKGPKVMGQLAAPLFHGQVCLIPSLSHLQGADKRSRVHFKCAIFHLESVAVNSHYEIQRAVTISEASHH